MTRAWAALLLLSCKGGAGESGHPPTDSGETAAQGCTAVAGPDQAVPLGVALDLEAEGAGAEDASWIWDLGDGTVVEGQRVTHIYTAPGVYTAVVQCTAPTGQRSSDSTRVNAHPPIADIAPRWSATIAVSDDGGQIFVVNPESPALSVIDAVSHNLQEWPACAGPRAVATWGDEVAVACESSGQIAVFQRATGARALRELPQGGRPQGVVGREGRWWVSATDPPQLVFFDADTARAVPTLPDPRGIALLPDGRLAISRNRSPNDGGQVAIISADLDEQSIFVLPVDLGGDSDTTTGGVPNLLEQVVPSPDGARLYLPFAHANLLRGSYLSGQPLTQDSTVRAVLATMNAETGAETPAGRKQFDERGRANAVAPSPLGERLYVLHTGTRTISVLDTWTGDLAGSILDVGHAPTGLALSPDGDTLYVQAWLDRQVHAYDVRDLSRVLSPSWSAATLTEDPLSPVLLDGKRIFWDAADKRITRSGYISCANCHPDGDHDGRSWDFTDRGEGMRNTPSLWGRAGMGMGPVHWSANFDEIQDFENDMRGPFGGTGFLSDADWAAASDTLGPPKAGRSPELDALAAYVASLAEIPASPYAASEGGRALFEDAGCATCHAGPHFTDSNLDSFVRHDVGTLTEASGSRLGVGPIDGLDTPTLLGSHATAPYLHDGSAESLEDAVRAHDSAAALSDETLSTLVDYIRSL